MVAMAEYICHPLLHDRAPQNLAATMAHQSAGINPAKMNDPAVPATSLPTILLFLVISPVPCYSPFLEGPSPPLPDRAKYFWIWEQWAER